MFVGLQKGEHKGRKERKKRENRSSSSGGRRWKIMGWKKQVERTSARCEEEAKEESKRVHSRQISLCPWISTWRKRKERSRNCLIGMKRQLQHLSKSVTVTAKWAPEKNGRIQGYRINSNVQPTAGANALLLMN